MDNQTDGKPIEVLKKKPSRLLILLHLFGGICLNAFAETSGLSKAILAPLSGSDPTSASHYASAAGLLTVGIVVVGYFLSYSLVRAIDYSSLSQKGRTIIKGLLPIAYIIGVILLAVVIGPILISSSGGGSSGKTIVPKANAIASVIAMSTVQSAEGVTDMDLDQAGLKNLETWTVNKIIEKSKSKYAEMGYDPNTFNPKIDANSVYVSVSGKKLAVIKINMDNSVRSVTIVGIKGNELHRVNCMRNSNHDIPVWSGECGNKIQEVFGVSLHP